MNPGTSPQSEAAQLRQRLAALEHENAQLRLRALRDSASFTQGALVFFTWACAADWPVAYASPNVLQLLGHTDEDFTSGRIPYCSIVHPDDLARVTADMQAYSATGAQSFAQEYRLLHTSGEARWISAFTTAVRNAQGAITHYDAYLLDTTSLRRAEEDELRIFRALADNAPDAIGIADPSGRVTYANPAFRAMFGYGDAIMGMINTTLFTEADQRERIPALLEAVVREGAWTGTLTGERRDGSTFPAQISPFAIRDGDDQLVAIPCILRDLSDLQRAAAERATLQEQVIATQQAAIHELSTPLLPLAHKVLALPLIGTIDSTRAQQVIETLLQGVSSHQAAIAIIDITGVHVVDTQVANALIQAAQAVKLLGAQVVLTGIRPEVAQTLISLGTDLGSIVTRSTLQDGIAYAMRG